MLNLFRFLISAFNSYSYTLVTAKSTQKPYLNRISYIVKPFFGELISIRSPIPVYTVPIPVPVSVCTRPLLKFCIESDGMMHRL